MDVRPGFTAKDVAHSPSSDTESRGNLALKQPLPSERSDLSNIRFFELTASSPGFHLVARVVCVGAQLQMIWITTSEMPLVAGVQNAESGLFQCVHRDRVSQREGYAMDILHPSVEMERPVATAISGSTPEPTP